jgi:SAM-dependent methyltransferase
MDIANYTNVKDPVNLHLGGNLSEGDPATFCPNVWNYIIDRFGLTSILDLGSGRGYAAKYFSNKGLNVVAVEGMQDNCTNSIYPSICVDITQMPVFCKVDLVHCQEVVEYIEEKYLENLLKSLTCGQFLLMTHAVPGQQGYHHVNLQPESYWVDNLKRYNFSLLVEDTHRIRRLASAEGAVYLASTGLLFSKI